MKNNIVKYITTLKSIYNMYNLFLQVLLFDISDKNKGPRQVSKSNQHDHDDFFLDNGGPSNTNDKQKSRSSHPPHLKGRDIGII